MKLSLPGSFVLRRKASSAVRRLARRVVERWAPFNDSGRRFDTSFWSWLEPVQNEEVAWFRDGLPTAQGRPWTIPSEDAEPQVYAAICREQTGFLPISFCHPDEQAFHGAPRRRLLSSIIPGEPYSYRSPGDYYDQYRQSDYAATFRKAGWDCFRHVEILASGCIPLMPDIEYVPPFSMVHYPKALMRDVVHHLRMSGDRPSDDLSGTFRDHYRAHLSCRAMAAYVLREAGLGGAQKILFVDRQLPQRPDYQSLLILIGLKQLLGTQCVAVPEVPYLYADWSGRTDYLYGRGFGYARVLDSTLRSRGYSQSRKSVRALLRRERFDGVVVGSIARNGPIAFDLLDDFSAQRTIWIHGEDAPPSLREQHFLRMAGTKVFIRSMPEALGNFRGVADSATSQSNEASQ